MPPVKNLRLSASCSSPPASLDPGSPSHSEHHPVPSTRSLPPRCFHPFPSLLLLPRLLHPVLFTPFLPASPPPPRSIHPLPLYSIQMFTLQCNTPSHPIIKPRIKWTVKPSINIVYGAGGTHKGRGQKHFFLILRSFKSTRRRKKAQYGNFNHFAFKRN